MCSTVERQVKLYREKMSPWTACSLAVTGVSSALEQTTLLMIQVHSLKFQCGNSGNKSTTITMQEHKKDLSACVCCPSELFSKLIHIFLVIAHFIILSLYLLHTHFSQRRIHPWMASPQGFFHLFSQIILPFWEDLCLVKPGRVTYCRLHSPVMLFRHAAVAFYL